MTASATGFLHLAGAMQVLGLVTGTIGGEPRSAQDLR
jgi:hypothetical protein